MSLKRTIVLVFALAGCGGSDAISTPGDLGPVDAARPADGPPVGGTSWRYTCGDPVCGGHRDHPGVPACTAAQTPGLACTPAGAMCDPMSACNQLLNCGTMDPTMCPISRRRYKEDIRYLNDAAREQYRRELLALPLATYHYRAVPTARRQLGFIIEDAEPSDAVDAERDQVDLYGYASMAVAALQVQARQIEALQREVARLKNRRR
jgi:hypothetical protein